MQAGLGHESPGEVGCLDLRTVTFGTNGNDLGPQPLDLGGGVSHYLPSHPAADAPL